MNFKKNTIKITALLTTAFCLFAACEKGVDPQKPEEKPTPEEPVEDDDRTPVTNLLITPIEQLNQGETPLNSHADLTSRSSLKMNYRSYTSIGKTGLGVDNPRYPPIKKMSNGAYIMFYHNAPQTFGACSDDAINNNLLT